MKIGLRNRGLYEARVEYDILDFVSANNAIYISLKSGNKGNALTDTDWWQCSIQGFDESTIDDIVGAHISGYQFGGVVSPDSTFTAGSTKMFFVAYTVGVYKDFGELTVEDNTKATFFFYDGDGSWTSVLSELRTTNGTGSGCCCCVTKEELETILQQYVKIGEVVVESIEINTILSLE